MSERETGNDPWAGWRNRISASKKRRDEKVSDWQENVDARKGILGRAKDSTDRLTPRTDRVLVNQDWPLTKAKIAQLYSQTPEVRLTPRYEEFKAAVPSFARELNETIEAASVGTTVEEVLCDVVNAAGIGGVLVSCEKRTEPREVPIIDPATLAPEQQLALMQGGMEIPTTTVDHTVDIKYLVQRISPSDLLIPDDFTGSNYDHARWLGEDGRMTGPQAVANFGLSDEQLEKALGADRRNSSTTLNSESPSYRDTDVISYTQLFYWRHYYHPEETNFQALHRLVFVDGLEEPVVNEPYQAQQRVEDGRLVGVVRNPIRVCTLTYISDDGLPPSDSTISRPQVDELSEGRDAIQQQRRHSIPIRWGDTNRIGPNARAKIDAGTHQGFIWVNGPGERAIGEVARASFPQERFDFDKIVKNDLTEQWQVGSNQAGAFASGERSAREAGIIERNFQRRVGQEQDKVQRFFLGIAEVLAGHLALYGNFDLPDELGESRALLANAFTYSVRVDSTVRLDAEQRIEQLTRALNLTAQSGFVNPKPAIEEIWELSGMDPAKVVIDPQPKAPEPVKVSVSKAEDLDNQLFVALLIHTGQAPTPEEMAAAAKLMAARIPALNIPPPEEDGRPPRDPETPGIANAGWETAPRIERRAEDGGA